MSVLMRGFLTAATAALCVMALLSLLYAVLGKRFTDKIVATNLIGTQCVLIIMILSVLLGADYILDVCLVFALLSFLMVVVLCRFEQRSALKKMRASSSEEVQK